MTEITVQKGDITKLEVDAIVNAANASLMGGGGVDGAIHKAGGSAILNECMDIVRKRGRCKTGEAVITTGGYLPVKKVIHTVGPIYNSSNKNLPTLLGNCYKSSLRCATENKIRTIAFPNISTGVYGYPKKEAAKIAIDAVKEFIADNPDKLDKVIFICFDDENYLLYRQSLQY